MTTVESSELVVDTFVIRLSVSTLCSSISPSRMVKSGRARNTSRLKHTVMYLDYLLSEIIMMMFTVTMYINL